MSGLKGYGLILMLALGTAQAQRPAASIPGQDVAAFVAGMLDIQLKRDDAAGAVFFFSQDGQTLLSQGYGLADVRQHIRMTDRTVVRGGALTFPVIAVAVMQQVEAAHISLDQDIRSYLDLPLPAQPDGSLTLRELMTNTAGFASVLTEAPVADLRSYLVRQHSALVYPAGAVSSYSPYGFAFAAYIVERVSGQPFPEYAQDHIFRPLRMTCSTLVQPVPFSPPCPESEGYGASTAPRLLPEALAPSLSLSTTAEDMGRFGTMLLNGGTLDGSRVLQPGSVRSILSRQTSVSADLSPDIPGLALGLNEIWFNAAHGFGQIGDTAAFHSYLEVDPQQRTVVFLAYNSSGHAAPAGEPTRLSQFARGELVHGIFDRYRSFHPRVVGLTPTAEQARLASGTWVPANEMRLPANMRHSIHMHIDPVDHSLVVDEFLSDRGRVKHWPMLLPNLWQQFPQDRIDILPSHNGLPDRLALAGRPEDQFVREP